MPVWRQALPKWLLIIFLILPVQDLRAQGLPVDTGSHIPVALWFVGVGILALVLIYGIWRTRGRTRSQKETTEQSTKNLYSSTERDRRNSGNP
jgi:hypothetical protein